ncbi:MAG: hypothetical protein ACI9G1_000417 [Pirellulaceae bacterium]|jgi:hypothetical protein
MNRLSRIIWCAEYFLFRCFALVLLLITLATHVPTEEFSGQDLWFPGVDEIDDSMILHSILYAILTMILVLAWTEQANIPRRKFRAWVNRFGNEGLFLGPLGGAAAISIMNELTRPAVTQTCSLLGFFVNMLGILLGFFGCVVFIRWHQPALVTVQNFSDRVVSLAEVGPPGAPIRSEHNSKRHALIVGDDNSNSIAVDSAEVDKTVGSHQSTHRARFPLRINLAKLSSATSSQLKKPSVIAPVVQEGK